MKLGADERQAKLTQLAEIEGFGGDVEKMLEATTFDSISPGICLRTGCDYTTEVEGDQTKGWCERCGCGSVASVLILAGLI